MAWERPSTKPPRLLVIAALVLGATAVVVLFAGAVTVGVTWDERVQMYMLQAFFDKGWHTGADIINGVPDPRFYYGTYVYGPVGELLPHLVNVVLGREPLWGTVALDADAYRGRHIGVALWGLGGLAAVGATVGVITRSKWWGLLAAALLASIPLWMGHAMFNIKDTPTATGYTLVTLGLVALVDSRYFTDRRIRWLALTALVLGLVVAIGSRTGIAIALIGALPAAAFTMWLVNLRGGRSATDPTIRVSRRFVEGLLACVAAYVILVAIYPKAFLNPIEVGGKALLDSALYPVTEAQLTNGAWMTQPVGWWYQPLWFGAQIPLLVLVSAGAFVVWWVIAAVRVALPGRSEAAPKEIVTQAVPVGLQLLLLPVAAATEHSTLYNGTRQMLFVVPAAAIVASLALWLLAGWLGRHQRRGLGIAMWVLIGVGIAVPVFAQVQLFPYGYSSFNAVAALRPIDGNWTTDYWRASGRELLRRTPGGPESCGFEQLQKGELFPCSEQPMFQPFLSERGLDAKPGTLQEHEYWMIRENNGVLEMPPGCRLFDTVNRPLLWRDITIGQILICDDRIDTGKRNMQDPTRPLPTGS